MRARHLELLVEERSMEEFLGTVLPRLLPKDCGFRIHSFQGKPDLLANLESRLRAYAQWLPQRYRVFVVIDQDNEDCRDVKRRLESAALKAGLVTRSQAGSCDWQVVNRIAIEEFEAWYFGDWDAVRSAYPRVSSNIPRQAGYRDPDAIRGGTWEAFERILKRAGYFRTGLRKIEAARAVGAGFDPARSCSRSFTHFRDAVIEAAA